MREELLAQRLAHAQLLERLVLNIIRCLHQLHPPPTEKRVGSFLGGPRAEHQLPHINSWMRV